MQYAVQEDPGLIDEALSREALGSGQGAMLIEYAVGNNGDYYPDGSGRLLKAGAKIRFSGHYHCIGEETTDVSAIGIKFYPKGEEPTRRVISFMLTTGVPDSERLNELSILVDVSHCSEQTGWDAMEASAAPVIVSHSTSKAVAFHDRGKTDELARAIAEQGGYFGVVVVPGFVRDTPGATLADFVRHVEHLVDVCGIDHIGIGTDKAGPGPSTSSLVEYPPDMRGGLPWDFNWAGFRNQEHRLTDEYNMAGFERLDDWPNVTVALAAAGFNEEELRKLLGLNYLRVFRDVVG